MTGRSTGRAPVKMGLSDLHRLARPTYAGARLTKEEIPAEILPSELESFYRSKVVWQLGAKDAEKKVADQVNSRDDFGNTPLHYAVSKWFTG